MTIRRCRVRLALKLQNGYPGDAELADCGWRGQLALWIAGLK